MTHMFAMRRQKDGIEHGSTQTNHPWANGRVDRTHRTIKHHQMLGTNTWLA
ncbi:MAG TPA: hypothetical protein VEY31_08595 [Roseococcus sp.]|jgi:hypothetical protein|nr:hypothetical protein [Roseococcus sp.]